MENTAAEEMYDFTKNRREKINLELSKIRSLYGREDVVYRFNAVSYTHLRAHET